MVSKTNAFFKRLGYNLAFSVQEIHSFFTASTPAHTKRISSSSFHLSRPL